MIKHSLKIYLFCLLLLFISANCLKAKRSNIDLNGPKGQLQFSAFSLISLLTNQRLGESLISFSYDESSVILTRTVTIAPFEPILKGSASAFSVNGTLPNGMSFDTKTGFISGTPSFDQAEKSYQISALQGSKTLTYDMKIAVTSNAPQNISYNGTNSGLSAGSTGSNLMFRRTVLASVRPTLIGTGTFSISPALPPGLSMNTASGTISGTPTVSSVVSTHIITVTNVFGSATLTLTISVLPVIYLATFGGGLAISVDGGNSFTMKTVANSGLGCNELNSVTVDNAGKILVANNSNSCTGGISVSSNNGVSFSLLGTLIGSLGRTILSETSGTIYFGTIGGFYYSTNSGISFTERKGLSHFASDTMNDIFLSGSNLYIVNGQFINGGLSISTDGGNSYSTQRTFISNPVNGISVSGSNVFAATSNGFFISNDSGANFVSTGSLPSSWKVVHHNSIIYVATLSNGVYKSTNNGVTFVQRNTANSGLPSDAVNAIKVYSDGTIYAGTGGGGLGISTDGGTSFVTRNGANGLLNLSIQGIAVR